MMAAPASMQAKASSVSSAGEIGTLGLRSLVVAPLMAASIITGVVMASVVLLPAGRVGGGCYVAARARDRASLLPVPARRRGARARRRHPRGQRHIAAAAALLPAAGGRGLCRRRTRPLLPLGRHRGARPDDH